MLEGDGSLGRVFSWEEPREAFFGALDRPGPARGCRPFPDCTRMHSRAGILPELLCEFHGPSGLRGGVGRKLIWFDSSLEIPYDQPFPGCSWRTFPGYGPERGYGFLRRLYPARRHQPL